MSLYQKASLVQIPSGYKASSANLYSVVPNNGDGDFTVSSDADATRVNKDGLIESVSANQARLNYDPTNPQDPHLLLEPARTNKVYPNNSLTGYSTSGVTTSNNQTTAPNGANEGAKVQATTSGNAVVFRTFSGTSGVTHNISVFVKAGTHNQVRVQEGFASANMVVNLSTATEVSSSNATNKKIEAHPNDWYRISFDFTSASTSLQYSVYFSGTYSSGDTFFMWGGQIEQGIGVTSLIATSGSAVTRTIDYASGAGNDALLNDGEGTLFIDVAALGNDGAYRVINISDGTTSNRVLIQLGNNNNQIRFDLISGSVLQTSLSTTSYTFTDFNKIAIKYKGDDTALFVNGTQVGTTQTGKTMPTGLDRIDFTNGNLGSTFYFRGKLKQLMYFDTALTNAELITLTS